MKWQQRLNEHEVPPHPQVWDALKDRMALQNSSIPGKMHEMEVPPPADAWNEIRMRLTEDATSAEKARIPLIRRISRRYASAAAMVASIILVTILYLRESTIKSDRSPAINAAMTPPIEESGRLSSAETKDQTGSNEQIDAVSEKATLPGQSLPAVSDHYQTSSHASASKVNTPKFRNTVQIEPGSNYIRICGSTGDCDRLTYKLEEWAPCIHESSAQSLAGQVLTEEVRRIESWRRNLEQSDYIPAAGHFLDILDMVSMLNGER
jgi:hypothetical protein